MKIEVEFVEYGKVFLEHEASDFKVLDRSSEKILDVAGSQRCQNFTDIGLRFPDPSSRSSFTHKAPNHAVAFLDYDKDHFLFVQIQRREEGEYARSIGKTPRLNRSFNQIRFSLVKKSQIDYCFLNGYQFFSSLLYKNSGEKKLGNHPNALKDYIESGGNTVGPLIIEVKEQQQGFLETLQENPNLKLLMNTIIENAKQDKRNQRLHIHLPDLGWKELLEIIEVAQILVFPVVGYFTFAIGDVTENNVDLVLLGKDQISVAKSISEQDLQGQYRGDCFAELLDLHRKYGDQFTKGEFINNLRNYFLQGMTIEQAGWLAEFSTLRDDRLTNLAPPPFSGGIKELLLLLDSAGIQTEFLQKLIPMALACDDIDLITIFLFLHHKGMFNNLIEKIKSSALSAEYKIKSYDAYLLVLELGHYFSGDLFEERFFETYQFCIKRKLPILHSGIVSAVTVFDDYKFSEYGIQWSQEVLGSDSERNILIRADLHDAFIEKIQRHYTKSVIPLDPIIEAIHIHFGHALLDENFISILRSGLDDGLSLWGSVLISAVMTNNVRDLTKDHILSLKNILESKSTLEIIKKLGMLEIFREKLKQLGVHPEPDVAAANPLPKPIATISLLRYSWRYKELRISLISGWSDNTRLRNLSRIFSQEGFDELIDRQTLYSEGNWLRKISEICDDTDVIIICLTSQSDLTTQQLLGEEIARLATKYDKKRIIPVRLDDCVIPLSLKRWLGEDLFEQDGYSRFVQELVRSFKIKNEPGDAMAAPPPNPSAKIWRILGRFLIKVFPIVVLVIIASFLLNFFFEFSDNCYIFRGVLIAILVRICFVVKRRCHSHAICIDSDIRTEYNRI